jgi:DNA-binding NarL/FixJ family response regulator
MVLPSGYKEKEKYLDLFEALQSVYGLTHRECEIACQVATGINNEMVAKNTGIKDKTVKLHLTNIFRKMKIQSRGQLIVKCFELRG